MKKYTTGILLFAVLAIMLSGNVAFRDSGVSVRAQVKTTSTSDSMMRVELATPGAGIAAEGVKKSEYILPYPGILQNHPLYFLKEFRDQIIDVLIADPLRKSEFYLLQSDKWIAASSFLIAQNNTEIAQQVLNKAATKMTASIGQLSTIKAGGRQVSSGAIDKLEKAIEKHLELVDEFSVEKKINPDQARQSYLAAQDELNKLKN